MNTPSQIEPVGAETARAGKRRIHTNQRPQLSPRSIGTRLAAVALAVLATVVTIGGQFGLVALYSGEAGENVVAQRREAPASQVAARGEAEKVLDQPEVDFDALH